MVILTAVCSTNVNLDIWGICAEFFQNKLVETIQFMEVLNLKDSMEKDTFFRKLPTLAEQLPRPIVTKKVLSHLLLVLCSARPKTIVNCRAFDDSCWWWWMNDHLSSSDLVTQSWEWHIFTYHNFGVNSLCSIPHYGRSWNLPEKLCDQFCPCGCVHLSIECELSFWTLLCFAAATIAGICTGVWFSCSTCFEPITENGLLVVSRWVQ